MAPGFLVVALHGVGFMLAVLCFGHPCIAIVIVLAIAAFRRSHPALRRPELSFKPEVQADGTGKWYGNALRFATREEAETQVVDLMMRWTAVRGTRVVESGDPVHYRYVDGRLESVVSHEVTALA